MIEINLLPKNYRKKQMSFSLGKTGVYAMGAAAAIVVAMIAISFYQIGQVSDLNKDIVRARERANMLRKDIRMVDALTDVKSKITQRMRAVDRLDRHRSAWVRILEDVARNVPEFVWIARLEEMATETPAKVTQAGTIPEQPKETNPSADQPTIRKVEVEGYSFTLNALAAFMIKMMRSDYFDDVELVSTEERELQKQKAYNFVLTCNLHYLSDEEMRDLIAKSKSTGKAAQGTSHASLN